MTDASFFSPAVGEVLLGRGRAELRHGQVQDACATLRIATFLAPRSGAAWRSRAIAERHAGASRKAAAMEELADKLEATP